MHRQRGFSLVELIFALVILTIVILTTLSMFAERSRRLQQAGEMMIAYQALSNQAELVRRMTYSQIDTFAATPEDEFNVSASLLAVLTPYTTNIEIEVIRPEVKRVTMTIKWSKPERVASLELIRVDTGATNLW
jgi:prepilin-type N-terminal cleavage/methylation domain-containing protein